MNNLDALNIVLDAIGVYPVTSYDSPHPDAARARQKLEIHTTSILTNGWWFNKECNFTLVPTINGEVLVPETALVVDSVDPYSVLTRRGNKLYDPENHTYKLDRAVEVDMITSLPFDDIPVSVQMYIARGAAVEMAVVREGDQQKLQALNTAFLRAKSEAFADELRNSNYNAFLTGLPARLVASVRPTVRRI
jgi:hypothetical protein